jgi:threonine dehydrogenase-like Zn-dependent dehydrogenase
MPDKMRARAFWVTRPGCGVIEEHDVAEPRAGEVLVRTRFSGISRGTESLVFHGQVPASEAQRMRAPFQTGEFPAPVKYGYINVGFVERGDAAWRGRHVFCLFPHQTAYCVPVSSVFAIPHGVPPGRAVLAANLETALNGLWDAQTKPGQQLAVIGAGAVGCLLAWLARRQFGLDVELIDIDPARAAAAMAIGVPFAMPDTARRGVEQIIHTSGSPAGLALALELAAFEACITEMSWYGDRPVTLKLGEAFHSQRLRLQSSQVGRVARAQRGHYTLRSRMEFCLRLLDDACLDALIDGESQFDELPSVMPQLADGSIRSICHRITYSSDSLA